MAFKRNLSLAIMLIIVVYCRVGMSVAPKISSSKPKSIISSVAGACLLLQLSSVSANDLVLKVATPMESAMIASDDTSETKGKQPSFPATATSLNVATRPSMKQQVFELLEGHVDVFRDTPVRYLGYANEVGESFKPIFPQIVLPSYVLAFAYVFADAMYKTFLAQDHGQAFLDVIRLGSDALLWQSLASVLIPGNIIAFITSIAVKNIRSELDVMLSLPEPVRKWAPTVIGLCAIPFIIEPIDTAVDMVFDYRFALGGS
eukprot:CAMPEP_0173188432 /NCGR_PEP_ID=MMETSP1141-20130122/11254_1 /TAXON_ID=483371 /ORGANISM="non described non described, Strain CCMP2298" /LENGTH=259 /DNA_ID=CAMNT_0014112365 /DNA_START=107 /DNA_END=884 /DNA_ORIENTATION=+